MSEITYKYSADAIISGMEAIKSAHNQIDTALDNLEVYAQSQLATWTGGAQDAYRTHKAEWDKGVDVMKDVMTNNAIPALNHILENYQTTERLNCNGWQSG